ncbi:DUF6783 domain-containing protein [Blautia sp. HCP3S3_H10_1]|uniref:DUF6783 domain-containing protein n=1 Tax=unclassified Blautia TaxID=2648079 RepID=UPI003F8F7135
MRLYFPESLERAPKRLSAKYTAKWGVQTAEMIWLARSSDCTHPSCCTTTGIVPPFPVMFCFSSEHFRKSTSFCYYFFLNSPNPTH